MKVLAFYLPQYHPIPENDHWWGAGFTEWTNVTKARPRFSGHYQPHLPADLGFYDLRLKESRNAQAELAKRYGIHGFCYYHYWFNGKRLLNRPLDDMLASGEPDFPFCICWANENWTRNWSGEHKLVLQDQAHSEEDDLNHINWLLEVFKDKRYILVEGRPLIIIYRSDLLPEAKETLIRWRAAAVQSGFPGLHIVSVFNNFSKKTQDILLNHDGFDAVIEFQPNNRYIPASSLASRISNKIKKTANKFFTQNKKTGSLAKFHVTYSHNYKIFSDNVIASLTSPGREKIIPTVIPSWDNSARRADGARVLQNTDPAPYEAWLRAAISSAGVQGKHPFVFINAWNEWAEGCHLEPDREVGHGFLEATQRAIQENQTAVTPAGSRPQNTSGH